MPAKNSHPYSEIGVFEYIGDNKGIRYQCNKLARVFHCEPDDMRDTLDALVAKNWIETASSGRARLYFVRAAEEIAAIAKQEAPKLRGEYRQSGAAWSEVARRLAEFRSGPSVYAELEKV